MPLIAAQRYVAMRQRESSGEKNVFFSDSATCGNCAVELQESQTGCRHMGDGSYLCSDCYFDSFAAELESLPVLPPRVRHRA